MIKIDRLSAPAELDDATQAALTAQYKASGDRVWDKTYIKTRLLQMSHHKCVYCETKLNEESKYMEVEHFYAKVVHEDRVVDWNNLLPSCKRCNIQKGIHDVIADGMLIDPTVANPQSHLKMNSYRLRGKDALGRQTTRAIYLNDSDKLVSVRMKIGDAVLGELEKIRDDLETYLAGAKTRLQLNRALRSLETLFVLADRTKEYSATVATVLLGDGEYRWIRQTLQTGGFWDQFASAEAAATKVALP